LISDADDRTEPATPRRRQEARARGQIPRSTDLTATLTLLAGIVFLGWTGPRLWVGMTQLVKRALAEEELCNSAPLHFAFRLVMEGASWIWPMLVIVAAVALVSIWAQVGWNFTLKPLTPSLAKLNVLAGLKRMFSWHSGATLATSLAKMSVLSIVAYVTIAGHVAMLLMAGSMQLEHLVAATGILIHKLGLRMALALLVLGIIDYIYQRFRHNRQLRMTKQEVRDEMKNMEGDPLVRQRRRRLQLQLAKQRLQHTVPQADMVLANPTHLSIALKYDANIMPAPRVVAKGEDELALFIREIARRCGIPVVERKSLVRMMYEHVAVGEYIPERFYQAVAEVLAYVYRLSGKRASDRRAGAA